MLQKLKSLFQRKPVTISADPLVVASWHIIFRTPNELPDVERMARQDQQTLYKEAADVMKTPAHQLAFNTTVKNLKDAVFKDVNDNESFRNIRSAIQGVEMYQKQLEYWAAKVEKPPEPFDRYAPI